VLEHFVRWAVGLASAETQTSYAERDALARHARDCRRVVEIGVWHGVTTSRLRAAMSRDGVVYAVDPFPPGRLGVSFQRIIAHREVSRVDGARVEWVRSLGHLAAAQVLDSGAVDFVFIDGDHTREAIERDWNAWSSGVKLGGMIALHDSVPTSERPIDSAGSVQFTRAVVAVDKRYALVDTVETLTVWQRK
jgi:predicted O-methyltransferase YrrM